MVNRIIDELGKKFGYLTVIRQLPSEKRRAVWECRCDCGVITKAFSNRLRNGSKRSCGCIRQPNLKAIKICPICNNEFHKDARNTWAYWKKAKYCSSKCFGEAHSIDAAFNRKPIEEEFSKHFDRHADGCWEWKWLKDKDGYGLFSYAGVSYRAAKLALKFDGRPVKDGQITCHTCDNPSCVRSDHLYPGTSKQNMADALARNRIRLGEMVHFSKLTGADIVQIRSSREGDAVLAERFSVTRSNITQIRLRKTWRHIP